MLSSRRLLFGLSASVAFVCAVPRVAFAQTCAGVAYYEACLDAIGGRPVGSMMPRDPARIQDTVFRTNDVPPRFAPQLTFGRLVPARSVFNYPACSGGRNTDHTQYTANTCMAGLTPDQVAPYSDGLDWGFVVTARSYNPGGLVTDGDACGGDRARCGYEAPWRSGMVMDLQGPANRVVVFPITDHVTDSCLEAFEYSVYLTDNVASTEFVPWGGAPDPTRWNAAVLVRGFTRGWTNNPQSTGTVADMAVHPLDMMPGGEAVADSIATVWALPCGVNFRYASIVPGNYGNPDARCAFHSSEYEWDAVAGLNEDGTAICPDRDGDGFRDAACGGTDCNDNDRMINPGATEDCRTTMDVNCDGHVPMCPAGTTCFNGICAGGCIEGACATGFMCRTGPTGGDLCVPNACAGVTCPAGQICGPMGCQLPCDGAMCPPGQTCIGGACIDACAGITCGSNQHCEAGRCVPNCSCLGCPMGRECNAMSGRCDATGCRDLACAEADRECRGAMPRCRMSFCDGVVCPLGQRCDESTRRCVIDRCFGIACPAGLECNEGMCVAPPRDVVTTDGAEDSGGPADDAGGDGGTMAGDTSRDAARRDGGAVETPSGCGCRVPAQSRRMPRLALAAVAFGWLVRGRRLRKTPRRDA